MRMRTMSRALQLALVPALLALATGCSPSRFLVVESDPPGAVVRLDDILIGRTPLEAPFDHYGRRRLTVYLEGYQTYVERLDMRAPWYARFPIDLVTEVLIPLGLEHRQNVFVRLDPDTAQAEDMDPGPVIERARGVRETVRRPDPMRPPPVAEPPPGDTQSGDTQSGDREGSAPDRP
jgi:hypothetical protein